MSDWSRSERVGLRGVVEAARRELRDRDPEDVPARLVRVAKSSARVLPPPLEGALVAALVDDDVLRAKVADRYDADDVDDPIGTTFLRDPAEALILARESAQRAEAEADRARSEREAQRLLDVEAELAEAKERLVAARRSHEQAIADLKERDRRARENLLDDARAARAERDRMARDLEAAATDRDEWRRRAEGLEAELSAEQDRRRRALSEAGPGTVVRMPFDAGDPSSLAQHLDRVERVARPYRRVSGTSGVEHAAPPLALPPGVAPDLPEAVDAVAALAPDLVAIDGYNLAGAVDGVGFHTRAGRDGVMPFASALRRAIGAPVVVVFDARSVDGRSRARSVDGIDVVFAQDRSADDEIVGMVAASEARTVVVTNDRDLRERCSHHGALAIWSDAVISWANR